MSNDVSPPRVNLNEADLETLAGLPGIGEGLAKRIIEYRETVGSFSETADIVSVPGISEKMYLDFADLVSVSADDEVRTETPSTETEALAVDELEADPAQREAVSGSNGHLSLGEEENGALPQPETSDDETALGDMMAEADLDSAAEAQIDAQSLEEGEAAGVVDAAEALGELGRGEAEIEAQPAPASQPQPSVAAQPAKGGFWRSLLLLIVGIAAGTALTLGILYGLNGTLSIDQHSHVRNLNNQVATLIGQNEALRTELQIMREQVNALSSERVRQAETAIQSLERNQGGLTNRMDVLTDESAGLENQMAGLETETANLTERTTSLESTSAVLEGNISLLQERSDQVQAIVDQLEVDAERFDTFLTGLGQLLQALQGQADESEPGQ